MTGQEILDAKYAIEQLEKLKYFRRFLLVAQNNSNPLILSKDESDNSGD